MYLIVVFVLLHSSSFASSLFFDPPIITKSVNTYRAKHGAPPVIYNITLTSAIQQWTNYLAANNVFYHSTLPYGENLGMTHFGGQEIEQSRGNITKYVLDIIVYWYNEVSFYNWSKPGFAYNTGHFTQLVWVKTKRIGVGASYSKVNNKLYVGMSFDPPGNYIGDFPKNVLPTSPKPPRKCACPKNI